MVNFCGYIRVPCTLLRMLLLSFMIGVVSWYNGDGWGWATGLGFASLVLMQIGYFAVVIIMVSNQRKNRN